MKGSGALQVDRGVCGAVHTKASLCRISQCVSSDPQRMNVGLSVRVHVCVWVGKSVHAPVVLTALFTMRSKAKMSIICSSSVLCCPSQSTLLAYCKHCTWVSCNFASWYPQTITVLCIVQLPLIWSLFVSHFPVETVRCRFSFVAGICWLVWWR